jgi:hypothetical protein
MHCCAFAAGASCFIYLPMYAVVRSASLQQLLEFLVYYSDDDAQEIENHARNFTNTVAMMHLLQCLPMRKENWFEEFVEALKQQKCEKALRFIEPLLLAAGRLLNRQ